MLSYEKIFSRVRNKIDDPRELSLDEEVLNEIYTERLHSVFGNFRLRNLFKSIGLNDALQELSYELNYSVDEAFDEEFVIELVTLGMIIEWLTPKVESVLYTATMIGGKEEKKILDHHKTNIDRLNSLNKALDKKITDYDVQYNSYTQV